MITLAQKRLALRVSGEIHGILQYPMFLMVGSVIAMMLYAEFVSLEYALIVTNAFFEGWKVSGYGLAFAWAVILVMLGYSISFLVYMLMLIFTRCKNCKHTLDQHEGRHGPFVHCRGAAKDQKRKFFAKANTCTCANFEG